MVQNQEKIELTLEEFQKLKRNYNNRSSYHRRKSKELDPNSLFNQLDRFGHEAVEVLKTMSQASISNPLLGITTSIVFADVLYRAHIIDVQAYTMILVSVGVIEGSAVAGTIISDISQLFGFFKSQNPAPDPITPTANVVVLGNSDSKDLQALLRKDVNL